MIAQTMEEYKALVEKELLLHSEYRRGQAYFNILFWEGVDPKFANSIRGTDLDPFHNDARIPNFLKALQEHWDTTRKQEGGGEPMSTVEDPTPEEEVVVPEESPDVEETGDDPVVVPEETPQDQ